MVFDSEQRRHLALQWIAGNGGGMLMLVFSTIRIIKLIEIMTHKSTITKSNIILEFMNYISISIRIINKCPAYIHAID